MQEHRYRLALALFAMTFMTTLLGVILYGMDMIGLAQMFWVLASGFAGAFVVAAMERL